MNNPENYISSTLPPPVGGLNFLDSIDAMPPSDARQMLNVFPDNESAKIRKGCTLFATISGGDPVARLYNLVLATGSEQLIACVDNKMYEVASGTPADITGSTAPTSNLWQSLVFKNRLFLVNGTNAPQVYTGSSTFADAGFTGTGLTPADVINIGAYRGRVYLIEKNTASAWYANTVGAVTGATTEFDLSDVFIRGGYLVAAGSYSNQLATASQDLWMAVSSEGEVLLYSGTHPGDSAWSIVQRFFIAKPIGYRCLVPYDSDMLILTRRGLIAVSSLFQKEQVGLSGIARNVNKYIREAAKSRANLDGWHAIYAPDERKIFLHLPISNTTGEQLVCNVDTEKWCFYRYSCEQPIAFTPHKSGIYMAGVEGGVFQAENGVSDSGEGIVVDLLWAWNYYGQRGRYKRFVDARPLTIGSKISNIGVQMETDYIVKPAPAKTITGASSTPWGSPWGSPWGGTIAPNFDRYGLGSQGHAGALRLFGTFLNVTLEINAVEVRYELGGQI